MISMENLNSRTSSWTKTIRKPPSTDPASVAVPPMTIAANCKTICCKPKLSGPMNVRKARKQHASYTRIKARQREGERFVL